MTPKNFKRKFLRFLRFVAYLFSIAGLIGVGAWAIALSISYLDKQSPPDNLLMAYGFLNYGILGAVAFTQWRVLKPMNVTLVCVADAAFWLSGMAGYVLFWAMRFNVLVAALDFVGFATLFFAAIRVAMAADPLGFVVERERLAEAQNRAAFLAKEIHR